MPRKILIVDDMPVNRRILSAFLSGEYDIIEAGGGKEALSILDGKHMLISAVLLDILMPDMEGYEVLRRIRANPLKAQIPVIMITGSSDEEAREKSLALGANDFVTKPYNPSIIRHCLYNNIALRETSAILNAIQRDKLTGLYTRETFFEKTAAMIMEQEPGYYIMACFDIDRFKVINDRYGTKKGDEVLKHISRVFKDGFDQCGGICCRVMADKFAVMYPASFSESRQIEQIRLKAGNVEWLPSPITFTIGRYVVDDLSLSPSAMYDRAALAEKSVKSRYSSNIAYFEESMRDNILHEQQIVIEMAVAVRNNQFEIWFQPQYNHANGALIGAEALVRWRHPALGLIMPNEFIPLFERNGFIYELDKLVWEKSCEYLRKWIDEGRDPVAVSVNVSRSDVLREGFVDYVTGIVGKYGLTPEYLRLEITESAFADSTGRIVDVVNELINLGFTLEIDDFGSGYSSLNTLKDVPVQIIKLDMRFLDSEADSKRGGIIINSVVHMIKLLGMRVIAEGVETAKQADFLKSIGCGYVQGYLYSRPMAACDYEKLLTGIVKEKKLIMFEAAENPFDGFPYGFSGSDIQKTLPIALSTVIGSTNDIAFVKDINSRYICLSPAFAAFVGLNDPSEAVGKTDYDFVEKEYADSYAKIEREIILTGKPRLDYDEILPSKDGLTHYASTSKYPLLDGSKNVIGIYGVSRDVTGTKTAYERLKLLTDSISGGLATYTCAWDSVRISYFNDTFLKLMGYSREEFDTLAKDGALFMVEKADIPTLFDLTHKLMTDGSPIVCTFRIRTKTGNLKWINMRGTLSERRADTVIVNAVFFDVTNQVETTQKLRLSEEEYRLAISHSDNVICRYNIDERALVTARDIAKKFSLAERIDDVPYGPVREGIVSEDTAENYIGFYEQIIAGNRYGLATFKKMMSGGWQWLEARFSTVFSETGQPVSAVISYENVTEKREKEAIYKKWQQSLEDKNKGDYTLFRCNLSKNAHFDYIEGSLLDVGNFGDALSLDERTSEYVQKSVFEDDKERYAAFLNADSLLAGYYRARRSGVLEYREKLQNGGIRWLRLSADLVEFPDSSDVEAFLMYENIDDVKRTELLTIERSQTDPLTGALNRVTFAARANQLIASSKPGTLFAVLMLDIDGFKMVNDVFGHAAGDQTLIDLVNSVSRALRRSDLLGRLGGDEFMILLNDIPNDSIAANKARQICALSRKAFSLEVQISSSIGIVVCPRDGNEFETLYRKADSALYYVKGSGKDNFAFYRDDMANEHLSPETGAVSNDAPKAEKRRRMLIVDDNAIDHELLSAIFKDDFIIEKAKDGASALIRLRHYAMAISVVLLDLMMPGMDGFSVLEKMRQSAELRGIPVIVVSADSDRETCLKAIRSGATDFVTKPVDTDLLKIRVRSAVSKAENERLRAKNSLLEMQSSEAIRYKTVLEHNEIFVIEYVKASDSFIYDSSISGYIAGVYDNRDLWRILTDDNVVDRETVEMMRKLTLDVCNNFSVTQAETRALMAAPSREKRLFNVCVYKLTNESGQTEGYVMAFKEVK